MSCDYFCFNVGFLGVKGIVVCVVRMFVLEGGVEKKMDYVVDWVMLIINVDMLKVVNLEIYGFFGKE